MIILELDWFFAFLLSISFSILNHRSFAEMGEKKTLLGREVARNWESRPAPMGNDQNLSNEERDAIPAGHEDLNGYPADLNRPLELILPKDDRGQKESFPGSSEKRVAHCSSRLFARASGEALVDIIRNQNVTCIDKMLNVTGADAISLFSEAKMLDVAAGLLQYSRSYQGTNSEGLVQLVHYLRAGYYVQFYNKSVIGSYTNVLKNAVAKGLDVFFAHSSYFSKKKAHDDIFSELISLMNSSDLNDGYRLKTP